jgi:prolyl oligopeptidase
MNREVWETAVLTSETGALGLGWSRQQAIDYLVEAAGDSPMAATFRTDRQAALPGQMLSYAIGRLEIQRLREEARQRLGARFDVREFHERVLENGNVTLPMLREHVERWLVAGAR